MLPIDKISKLGSLTYLSLIVAVLKCDTCTRIKKKKNPTIWNGLKSLSLSLSKPNLKVWPQKKKKALIALSPP